MTDAAAVSYEATGFLRTLGLRLIDTREGWAAGELILGPTSRNRAGYVHGGVLCTMIDFAACAAGLHAERGMPLRFAVTLSLTTQFMRPARTGLLRVEGRMTSAGRRVFTAEAHVRDEDGGRVASGVGTFQWRKGSEPGAAPKP